jgi:acyl carrier protein
LSHIKDRVRYFISSELSFDSDPSQLGDDEPLLGTVVDSLGLTQLLSFIEEEFGVTIEDSEITPDNFRSLSLIERLISNKL